MGPPVYEVDLPDTDEFEVVGEAVKPLYDIPEGRVMFRFEVRVRQSKEFIGDVYIFTPEGSTTFGILAIPRCIHSNNSTDSRQHSRKFDFVNPTDGVVRGAEHIITFYESTESH
jgi:hypothetical protein